MTGRTSNFDETFVRAVGGGLVQLPALTTCLNGSVVFTADGTDSTVQLLMLTSFDGSLNFKDSGFRATNDGLITLTTGTLTVIDCICRSPTPPASRSAPL